MRKKGKRPAKRYRTKYDSISKRVSFSFSNLCDIYLTAKQAEGLADNTMQSKRRVIQLFLKHNGNSKPEEFTTEDARNYVNYLRYEHVKHANNSYVRDQYKTAGMSIGGVNTHLSVLRAMFRFLYEEKYIENNPFERVKMLKEPTDKIEALTLQQARRLIKEPDRRTYSGFRDAVLYTLMLDCGLRLGEAIQLKIDDIDFTSNTIYIPASNAKGKKGRFVPFSQKTSRLLRELRVEVEDFATPYMFTTIYGNPLEPSRVRTQMKRYADLAGITGVRVSPHILRHTFAKYYLLNGGDLMTLQKILGHSSLDMVRRYVQMTGTDINAQHGKFSPIKGI